MGQLLGRGICFTCSCGLFSVGHEKRYVPVKIVFSGRTGNAIYKSPGINSGYWKIGQVRRWIPSLLSASCTRASAFHVTDRQSSDPGVRTPPSGPLDERLSAVAGCTGRRRAESLPRRAPPCRVGKRPALPMVPMMPRVLHNTELSRASHDFQTCGQRCGANLAGDDHSLQSTAGHAKLSELSVPAPRRASAFWEECALFSWNCIRLLSILESLSTLAVLSLYFKMSNANTSEFS
jgi:hypothetical protein